MLGLVVAGPPLRALLAVLRQRNADELRDLLLTTTRDLLVLRGPAERLPWIDGAGYCTTTPGVPGLWLPTRQVPDLPMELLYTALRQRSGHAVLLLWNEPELVLGLDDSLPVRPDVLDWLEGALS